MPKQKPFVAVIGGRNSGKSTVIRSLTGARSGQFRGMVHDRATQETISVIGSSPQEQALTLQQLRSTLRTAMNNSRCRGIVCALQPSFPTKRLSLEQVLQEARALRFRIRVFVLDPGYKGARGHLEAVAARVRNVGFGSKALDGRRFAQVNAGTINRRTRIAA